MERKKLVLLMVVVLLVISISVPLAFLSLFIKEKGDTTYCMTYKEFYDQYDSLDLKDGDVVYIKDTFSDIWYNQSAHYTYMTFQSMEGSRTDPWGYDAGYPEDITADFHAGDKVLLKTEMRQEMNDQGVPTLVGHIQSIEYTD